MKKILLILWVGIGAQLFAQEECRVIRIVDGDTYELLCNSQKKIVRHKNVDAPEMDQYYGKIVTDSLTMILLNKVVLVEREDRDLFGRHLVKICLDGQSLDSLLIAKGWAWHYHAFSDSPWLAKVQDHARENQKGIWQCGYNAPPWVWRSLNKRNKRFYRLCR